MSDSPSQISPWWILAAVMLGLVAWGAYLAIGSYLYNLNPWRPVVVMGCVLAFIAWWGLLLAMRQRRRNTKV